MEKKLNNLLNFSDFEKNWKPEEQKMTKRTETGFDVLKEELNPETYDKISDAGWQRNDLRGRKISNTALSLKFRNVIGKKIKIKATEDNEDIYEFEICGAPYIMKGSLSDEKLLFIPYRHTDWSKNSDSKMIYHIDENKLKINGHPYYIDRHGARLISEIGKLYNITIPPNTIKQF